MCRTHHGNVSPRDVDSRQSESTSRSQPKVEASPARFSRRFSRRLHNTAAYCTVARMEASSSALNELSQLLLRVVSTLPPETHPLVLRHLPAPELARLSCVHKALHVAWRSLQEQQPGKRYAPPSADDLKWVKGRSRLERAAVFGDEAVIRSIVAAGVDERGTPLLRARDEDKRRIVDNALWRAASRGHLHAVELLLGYSANVHAGGDWALWMASMNGHTAVVQLLIQHGANVHAGGDQALRKASENGHADVVQLLLQHGADVHAVDTFTGFYVFTSAIFYGHAAVVQLLIQHGADVHVLGDNALRSASYHGHTAVVQLLIQHGAHVRARDDVALQQASKNGHTAVVQLLIQHGANVHAKNEWALRKASKNGHADVVQILTQHGAVWPTEFVEDSDDEDDEEEDAGGWEEEDQ
jgi:ankyrin repeat protein